MDFSNEWAFSGEIVRIREFENNSEFSASLTIRGCSSRRQGYSKQIVELVCIADDEIFNKMQEDNFDTYTAVYLSGHLESWITKSTVKTMFIIDHIEKRDSRCDSK